MTEWFKNGYAHHSLKLGEGLLWVHVLEEAGKKTATVGHGLSQIREEFTSLTTAKTWAEDQVETSLKQMLREVRSNRSSTKLLWMCLWLWIFIGLVAREVIMRFV